MKKMITVPLELFENLVHLQEPTKEEVKEALDLIQAANEPMITIDDFAAKLARPIVILDVETTGINTVQDRAVSISLLKVWPSGTVEQYSHLINPRMPIPEGASAIHGITDETVMDADDFCELKDHILHVLSGCDIGHFNGDKFDVPLLCEEFNRCGIQWPEKETISIDVSNIFRKKEGRSLSDAVKFYLQADLENAHNADIDADATLNVLLAQLKRYPEYMDMTLDQLQKETMFNPNAVDIAGKFAKNEDGDFIYTFGKHKDSKVKDFPSYVDWMLGGDFTADTKRHGRRILEDLNYL